LNRGADGAKGDDTSTLKHVVISWLMERCPTLNPVLDSHRKSSRGFNHEVTGRLLCPVDYDWDNPSVKAGIQEYHPDYLVTAYSWPSFLYKGKYDPKNPTDGLFQGELLIRAFRCIFTSPSSANAPVDGDLHSCKVRRINKTDRMRCDVAGLLQMRAVQPQAIAYIAVQLRFALSSCESWCIKDEDFDYEVFYQNIVDYFEQPGSSERAKEIDDLLFTWNR
ncbi:hypothetical protein M404DRAFT_156486, partial [Pisolithus tinctorius Marx 270]